MRVLVLVLVFCFYTASSPPSASSFSFCWSSALSSYVYKKSHWLFKQDETFAGNEGWICSREWQVLLSTRGLCSLLLHHSPQWDSVGVDLRASSHSQYENSLEYKTRCCEEERGREGREGKYRGIHSHRSCHSCRSPLQRLIPRCTRRSLRPWHSPRGESAWSHRQIHFDWWNLAARNVPSWRSRERDEPEWL